MLLFFNFNYSHFDDSYLQNYQSKSTYKNVH